MNSPYLVQTEPFRRHLAGLLAQLQNAEVIDFGGVARRTYNYGIWLVEAIWHDRGLSLDDPSHRAAVDEEETRVVGAWTEWAYKRNQFFDLDASANTRLRQIHRRLRLSVSVQLRQAESFEAFARSCELSYVAYAERLSQLFRRLTSSDALRVSASEYSPELQIRLLGLNDYAWREPVVDLGCGLDAQLVHYLRKRGISANGVDRRGGGAFVLARDWFELRFEPRSIGTIVSHLAFSLHFLHQHWQGTNRAYDYARKYMELLHSLTPDGVYCYTPGLPFIEGILDKKRFEVTTLALPEPLASTVSSLRDLGTGQSVAYACRVRAL
jgi:hypothetical protein